MSYRGTYFYLLPKFELENRTARSHLSQGRQVATFIFPLYTETNVSLDF